MDYIIFDLEFTVLRQRKHLADILEIGAIKLREDGGEITMVDLFHSYVQPTHHKSIGALTTNFTGITQEQVDRAPSFRDVAASFRDWLQLDGNTYYLCSWGPDDKHQLVRHCAHHNIDNDWIRNYNDIQLAFTRLQGKDHGQRIGLKKALQEIEASFFGKQHHALDDAFNTAKLFKRVFPQLILQQNNVFDQAPTIVYSTGEEKSSPFSRLPQLLGWVV